MTRRQQLSCFGRAPCVALKVRWGFPLCWFYRVTHLKLFKIKSSPPRELAVGVKLTGGRIKGFCFSLKPSEWILLCFTGGSCHFESQRDDANSCLSVWNNPVKKKKKKSGQKKKTWLPDGSRCQFCSQSCNRFGKLRELWRQMCRVSCCCTQKFP